MYTVIYDRDLLKLILVYHQANSDSSCICGWKVLGASHAAHVVSMYELAVGAKGD